MAPITATPTTTTQQLPYSLYLFLTFPCFTSLCSLSPSNWTRHIQTAAHRSDSLCIIIQFTLPNTSPWSTYNSHSHSHSTSTGNLHPTPTPTAAWTATETFLARAYGAATNQFLTTDRVLARVDVVLEEMRGMRVCVPEGSESVKVKVGEHDEEEGEAKGKGKGKGKIIAGEERSDKEQPQTNAEPKEEHSPAFPVTALGGTFDHLHAGHKILLTMAASITTRKLIVGVTDQPLLINKKYHTYLESLPHRISSVEAFLSLIRPTIEHQVVPISDPFGPTASDPDIQGLVVSEETRSGGSAINTKRLSLSPALNKLEMLVINLVADGDGDGDGEVGATVDVAKKMGSTGIRGWLAAREGRGRE